MSGFKAAEYWCGLVRGEYERKEGEDAAKREQKALLERSEREEDSGASVSGGAVVNPTEAKPESEETLEAILSGRAALLVGRLSFLQAQGAELKAKRQALLPEIKSTFEELQKIKEVQKLYAPQVLNEISEDICGEVSKERQEDSGGVGTEDRAEAVSQAPSGQSEGTSLNEKSSLTA